jgi:hypothetical protein
MNTLAIHKTKFNFDVEPIFKIYEDTTRVWGIPTPERVIGNYDVTIKHKLDDLYFSLNSIKETRLSEKRWDLNTMQVAEIIEIEESINMKLNLEVPTLIEVFNEYHMMHAYYDMYFNFPTKEVW